MSQTTRILAVLALLLTIGGCTPTNTTVERSSGPVSYDLTDGQWHENPNDSEQYRYAVMKTPDGEMHCITYNDYRKGGLSCWPAPDTPTKQ